MDINVIRKTRGKRECEKREERAEGASTKEEGRGNKEEEEE